MKLRISIGEKTYDVEVEVLEEDGHEATKATSYAAPKAVEAVTAKALEPAPVKAKLSSSGAPAAAILGGQTLASPLPATVIQVHATAGKSFKRGEALIVIEAMKMETEVFAPRDLRITSVDVAKGDSVSQGQSLMHYE